MPKTWQFLWLKIISRREINKDNFKKFLNKYKPIIKISKTKIRLTVDIFLGPEELLTEIKLFIY